MEVRRTLLVAATAITVTLSTGYAHSAVDFEFTFSDAGNNDVLFALDNNSTAGETITDLTLGVGTDDDINFEGSSNESPSDSSFLTSQSDSNDSLTFAFDGFGSGDSFTFNSGITDDAGNDVGDPVAALLGALDITVSTLDQGSFTRSDVAETTTTFGSQGNDRPDDTPAVPVPATFGLLAAGLIGLGTVARRRR